MTYSIASELEKTGALDYSVLSQMKAAKRAELYALLGDNKLSNFIRFAWQIIEPGVRYTHGWHVDAISEHLEAVSRGEIRNLIINIPPRHGKSSIISVCWPAWVWTFNPEKKWVFASYGTGLSTRDTIRMQNLVQDEWYSRLWGDRFKLTFKHQDYVINDKMGHRLATSVSGGSTGEGGDVIVADDPHKIEEADSETMREFTIRWWDEVMSGRINDPKTACKVIVMQRVHMDDLTGHCLTKDEYVHLSLPTLYEAPERKIFTPIGWSDPRSEEGELLWPERFGPKEVESMQKSLGPYAFASQHQQRPTPRGGGQFHPEWFTEKYVEAPPHFSMMAKVIRYWDKAGTSAGGAFTCGVLMGVDKQRRVYVMDVIRKQLADLEREEMIRTTAYADRQQYPNIDIWIEQEPGSGGKDSAASTIRNLAGFKVYAERATGDKQTRAGPFAAYSEAGNVYIVRRPWNATYMFELGSFPNSKYKDQVDASSGAFNRLFRQGMAYNIK